MVRVMGGRPRLAWLLGVGGALAAACAAPPLPGTPEAESVRPSESVADHGTAAPVPYDPLPGEARLSRLYRLTHDGSNAEAYFSADARQLVSNRGAVRPHTYDVFVSDWNELSLAEDSP